MSASRHSHFGILQFVVLLTTCAPLAKVTSLSCARQSGAGASRATGNCATIKTINSFLPPWLFITPFFHFLFFFFVYFLSLLLLLHFSFVVCFCFEKPVRTAITQMAKNTLRQKYGKSGDKNGLFSCCCCYRRYIE